MNLALQDYFGHVRLPPKVKSHSHIKKELIQDSSKWATFTLAHTREHFKALAGTLITERSRETGRSLRKGKRSVIHQEPKMMVKLQAGHSELTFRGLLDQINPCRKEEEDSLNGGARDLRALPRPPGELAASCCPHPLWTEREAEDPQQGLADRQGQSWPHALGHRARCQPQ